MMPCKYSVLVFDLNEEKQLIKINSVYKSSYERIAKKLAEKYYIVYVLINDRNGNPKGYINRNGEISTNKENWSDEYPF